MILTTCCCRVQLHTQGCAHHCVFNLNYEQVIINLIDNIPCIKLSSSYYHNRQYLCNSISADKFSVIKWSE